MSATELNQDEAPRNNTYCCSDCDWEGDLVAVGQCPECGSLISMLDDDVPERTHSSVATDMRKRGWQVSEPTIVVATGV